MAKSFSHPRILPQRGGLRLSDQQRRAARIWYNWYAGGGAPAIFVSNAGSGDGTGSGENNSMDFDTFNTKFAAGEITGTVYLKRGDVYDWSGFEVRTPATQCSNLRMTQILDTSVILEWGRGLGDFILIALRTSAAVEW